VLFFIGDTQGKLGEIMLSIVILAAGKGTRMNSGLPKVLQPLSGKPLLEHVVRTARLLHPKEIIIVHGYAGDTVKAHFTEKDIKWAQQKEQLGTGHAVMQATDIISNDNSVLVLYGDVPLVSANILELLISEHKKGEIDLLTTTLPSAEGYGRILRCNGNVQAIIEEAETNKTEKQINEINTGIMYCEAKPLKKWLSRIENNNSKNEYYLTDVIDMATKEGVKVKGLKAEKWEELMGINDKKELAQAERNLQQKLTDELMQNGVTLIDPARVDIRGSLKCGKDVVIDINNIFEGDVILDDNVSIGPNNYINNSQINNGSVVHANSHIDGALIGKNSSVGPYARLRPGAKLQDNVKIGNFVEIKKSTISDNSKVNHLSYIGDTEIGSFVNVGAGTITCNYDGANKHKTEIKDGAFIGSGVELVAPVVIGENATVGAGSTISKSAPEKTLTVERAEQVTVDNWKRPKKKS